MKNSVLKELSTPELLEKLKEERAQFVKLKISHAVSPLENPMQIKAMRKEIARMQTEVRVREINEASN